MKRNNQQNTPGYIWHLALLAGVGIAFLISMMLGSATIPVSDVLSIVAELGDYEGSGPWQSILWEIRFPRATTAIFAGAALSLSGLQMQTLFRNPLAGPSVLGITAGASLGVAVVLLGVGGGLSFISGETSQISSWLIVIAASLGSFLILLLILLVALKLHDNVTLLIVGLMVGNMTIALVSIWQYYSNPEQIQDYLIWVFGSLGGVYGEQLWMLGVIATGGGLVSLLFAKPMNGFLMGEHYARSMGISVKKIRIGLIFITSILAGGVTAFCGPIGFIGIAVPHLVRSLFGTNNHLFLVPGTLLMGALLMLVCDIVAKLPGSPQSLPISSVTALIGSPVVIWVIIKQKNLKGAFA